MNWCEYFLNLLSTTIGAGVGILGAYQICRLQVKHDDKKIKEQKLIKERDFLDYYTLLLEDFKETVDYERENIQVFINLQRRELSEIQKIDVVSRESFIRLKTIDHSQLFNAWLDLIVDENKILKYRRLQTTIDFIQEKIGEVDGIYDQISNIVMNYLNNIRTDLLTFIHQLGAFLIDCKKNNEVAKNKDYIGVAKLFSDHIEQRSNIIQRETRENHQTYSEIKRDFLEPLKERFMTWTDIPQPLIEQLFKIMDGLQHVELQIKDMLEIMEKSQEEIKKYLPDIEEYFRLIRGVSSK